MRRVGIDVGGTFTDVVMFDDDSGQIWTTKVPTTPSEPTTGALNGLAAILELSGAEPGAIDFIGHGTTIATNMVIEGKGAKTALLTTEGFRDVMELRRGWRHDRADLYDLFFEAPKDLVPRHLRREVKERVHYDGSIGKALEIAELDSRIDELEAAGVEAVAVSFINSPVNETNERAAIARLRQRRADLFVSGSVEVNPEIMEYERTCTTIVNALLGPRCGQYARNFTRKVRSMGVTADVFFMQSNGGLTPPEMIGERPVTLLASGPAGGVTAVARLCQGLDVKGAIAGDMGGTSFDVSLVRDARPEMRNATVLNTYTVRCPNIDIISIGAGGGSIAWVDEAGGIRIGPESAGADPGPACYGKGGTRPTVTDCNLVLGFVDAGSFIGGGFSLDITAAERAIRSHLADPLGVSVEDAALTVRRVANALMAQAMRLVTVERGYDPRDFVYIPYGGAGPVHAVDLARDLEVPSVVLPPLPGVFSAFGMLVADLVHDLQASIVNIVDEVSPEDLQSRIDALEAEARTALHAAGVTDDRIAIERRADCCYLGQGDTMQVEVVEGRLDRAAVDAIGESFISEHRRQWNFDLKGRPVRLVNLRIRAIGKIGQFPKGAAGTRTSGAPQPLGQARIRMESGWVEMPRYRRDDLCAGDRLDGPLVVEELSSRIVIGSGDRLEVRGDASVVVTVGRN
jgi:N-methylhydantoinase A